MKVILQEDVKDLGKVGDLVQVKPGYARNFLFPRSLALEATEKRVKQFKHLKMVAAKKADKALETRKGQIEKLQGQVVNFKVQASDEEKLFGSIGALEISRELEVLGFQVDKRDIKLEEPIKVLGQHKANIVLPGDLTAEITVSVERI